MLRPTAQANGMPPQRLFTANVLLTMKCTSEGLMSGHKELPTKAAPVFAHVLTLISCVALRYRPTVLNGALGLLKIGRHESSVLPMKLLLNAESQYGSPLFVFCTTVMGTPYGYRCVPLNSHPPSTFPRQPCWDLIHGNSYTQYVVTTWGKDCAETSRSPSFGSKGFIASGVDTPPVLAKISLLLSSALLKVYATSAVSPRKARIFTSFCSPL